MTSRLHARRIHFSIFASLVVALLLPVSEAVTKTEAQVQCTARCLQSYRNKLPTKEAQFIRQNPELVMLQCTKNLSKNSQNCLQCIDACSKVKLIADSGNCEKVCKVPAQTQCLQACEFLRRALKTKKGRCPPSKDQPLKAKTEGLQLRCTTDAHCFKSDTRCCPSPERDRKFCVKADIDKRGMPPLPLVPAVRKVEVRGKRRRKEFALSLNWAAYDLIALPDPVIFIVQIRWSRGYGFDRDDVTEWADLVMTCRRSTLLHDLKAGTWYQVRLGATSARGMRGYSTPSDPIRLMREPKRPPPPRELVEGTARIHGNVVDIEMTWKGPRRSPTTIDLYEIMWTKHYGYVSGESQAGTQFKASVAASTTSYTLANLQPGTTYKVEVTSVSKFGDTELRSLPASVFVTTISIPSPAASHSGPEVPDSFRSLVRSSKCLCRNPNEKQSTAIVTKTPYFEKGKLKMAVLWNHPKREQTGYPGRSEASMDDDPISSYRIKWAPKVCVETAWRGAVDKPSYKAFTASVHGSLIYYLTDLQFNCHYIVRISGITSTGTIRPLWDSCFCTPNCFDVRVKSVFDRPNCGVNAVRGFIPNSPQDLRYEVDRDISGSQYSVKLVWNTLTEPDVGRVLSYRVRWGPRRSEPIDVDLYGKGITPLLDMGRAESKVVNGQRRSLVLHHLNESTVYIAQIKSVSAHGESATASIFFTTPGRRKEKPHVKTVVYHVDGYSSAALPLPRPHRFLLFLWVICSSLFYLTAVG